jgi:hypothetical protein
MNNIKQHIKKVLTEEKGDDKVNLAKSLIYDLFDEVSHVEQSKFKNKPLLFVYFDSDKTAVNVESWFDKLISKTIMEYTGDHVVVCPYWAERFDYYKTADIYISSLKLKHDNSENVMKEEKELNERCWKGYTQKGMKTMFGKRYPNCVKIKKKKSVRETIKDILDEEVTKKYPKPNEKVDKLVYKWLDDYFEGSQMYKKESWKYYSFHFEFCKNGREIAELNVRFDDKSPDFGPKDERPTNERSVDQVWLYVYPVMIDELLTDIPIRKNYMMYLIEEWFEDTKLDEIQKEFNRNDMSLDYVFVSESKMKGELCVPPISKPEDITMQEMKDLIKKNTLYSYKDMEKHEEEEPGWTEELYMGILQNQEHKRINQEDRENNH